MNAHSCRPGRRLLVAICLITLITTSAATALIMVGRGNTPVADAGWPNGALGVANLKSRVGWCEGPPFGGGEWTFYYRGDSAALEEAIKSFSGIRAAQLQVFLHDGPQNCTFLKDAGDPQADTHYDWSFTVWRPESWHRLFNDPRSTFTADSPHFRKPVDPPRIDIYLSEKIDWKRITVPPGVQLIDERVAGVKSATEALLRGDIFDMATGKPINGAKISVEKYGNKPDVWESVATGSSNANGQFEVTRIPAGNYRITASATGFAPRAIGYQEMKSGSGIKQVIELSAAARFSGTISDAEGKPLANVKISATNVMGMDGRGYKPPARAEVSTDANGRFTLTDLPTGYAQAWATLPGWFHVDSLKLFAVPEPNGAALQMVATGKIKGKVVNANGKPNVDGTINANPPGDPIGKWGGSMNVAADGTFEFNDVPPGPYTVSTQLQYPGMRPDPNAKQIRVQSGKTVEVTIKK
jgi:5-hydroxyisourate hydrolase-like protein (transthyretin family)